MQSFYFLATCTAIAWAATIPPHAPMITNPPSLSHARDPTLAKRQASTCSLVDVSAFSVNGEAFPASKGCNCDGGIQAGASSSVGSDGATTWNCANAATPSPISTETPAPTPTWVMRVYVGSNTFMAGDYDQSKFRGLMGNGCAGSACFDTLIQNFEFNWTQSSGEHLAMVTTGTVTMDGLMNSQDWMKGLLDSINTALLASSKCQTVASNFPDESLKKRGIIPAPHFETHDIPQCHIISEIKAALWNDPGDMAYQMGWASMTAQSVNPFQTECEEILGDINMALGLLPLPPYIPGGVTIAEAICEATNS